MKLLPSLVIFSAIASISAAMAQDAITPAKSAAEAAKVIETRVQLFKKELKSANDPIAAILKRQREMDTAVVAASAAQIQQIAARIPAAFLVDTREFKGVETQARDNIWASFPDFKVKADDLNKAATNLVAVAKTGDKGETQKAILAMTRTCGACHDNYKVKL